MNVGDKVEVYANPRWRNWESAFKRFERGEHRVYVITSILDSRWVPNPIRARMVSSNGKLGTHTYYFDSEEVRLFDFKPNLDKFM